MNTLINTLIKLGLLKEDLDYHLLRASMVIIFLAFGYQKWFEYEAQVLIPYISNGPLIFWMYPVFGIRGASWRAPVPGILEQEIGHSRSAGLMRHLRFDRHHHSIHAPRLGSGCRLSGDGGQCSFSSEGRGAPRSLDLFAEAGCAASVACRPPRRGHETCGRRGHWRIRRYYQSVTEFSAGASRAICCASG
jgi:uncharacterized protein DUF417